MSTETQIIIGDTTSTLSLAPDAEQIKAAALEAAAKITQVKTGKELEEAVAARRGLNDIDKGVERQREKYKKPILDAGRDLDALAKTFVAPVVKERDRLDGHINHYQGEQLRIAEEARLEAERKQRKAEAEAAVAQAEIARLEKEAAAAKVREEQAVADAIRMKEEAARAKDGEEKAAAEQLAAEAERNANAARAQQEAAEEASMKAEIAAETVSLSSAVIPAPVQLKGVTTKTKRDYRVTGRNAFEQKASLILLAKTHPHLVNIEIRRSDTLAVLNEQDVAALPGLEIFNDTKTTVR